MFYDCVSLTKAPELPATTLESGCYRGMFGGCTSLTKAPELPATILDSYCYKFMFKGCSSLNVITCLATQIYSNECTYSWVKGVSSSVTFYKHPDMTSWTRDTNGIPSDWVVQEAILVE
jgi:hypothetical protein